MIDLKKFREANNLTEVELAKYSPLRHAQREK